MAVELVAEPGIHPRNTFVGLLDVKVKKRTVDPFGEETVGANFHIDRTAPERFAGCGVRLGPDLAFAVDVAAGGGNAIFDVAESALTPVFTGDLVRLATVLQKLAAEPPVPVTLQPGFQTLLVAGVAQAADITVSDFIGDEAAEIPEKAVRFFRIADNRSEESGKIRRRVIAELFLELLKEGVGRSDTECARGSFYRFHNR